MVQRYLRERRKLQIINGILYRNSVVDEEKVLQLCLPDHFKDVIFVGLHKEIGHPGIEKTVWLFRQRVYWPGLANDIKVRVENCERCIRSKTPVKPRAELCPITSTKPLDILCIDFLSLEKCKGGYENILVMTDHFTRYACAVPCKNQLATTTAKAIYENFIVHYSFPDRLHSDQGRNFESKVIKEFCKIANIKKSRTTPYHPEGNGSVERFNQTLLKMLSSLEDNEKLDWKSYVPSLVHAYNATKNDATGYSPHFLMFGWHPHLSIDAFLGLELGNVNGKNHQSYVEKLQKSLKYSYRVAAEESRKIAVKNKDYFDQKVKYSKLEIGDKVLVRKVGFKEKHKLADKWDKDVFVISDIPNAEIPVYVVKREDGKGRTRTLHRNFLLPFNFIPINPISSSVSEQAPKKQQFHTPVTSSSDDSSESSSDESDRGCTRVYIIPQRRHQHTSLSELHDSSCSSRASPSFARSRSSAVSFGSSEPGTSMPVRRTNRVRKPPDRYGEWQSAQQLGSECVYLETLV